MTIMIYFIFCCNFNAIIDIKSYICEKLEEWMMRQILLYVFLLFVCSVSAEQFRITGKVVDAEYKEPMIGTTVEIKGTDRRTATDIDGNFSIEVEKGAILKFSYCGCYSKEVEILTDSSLVIELEDKSPEDMTPEEIEKLRIVCIQGWRPSPWRPTGPFSPVQPVEPDSLKTNPKNQDSMKKH